MPTSVARHSAAITSAAQTSSSSRGGSSHTCSTVTACRIAAGKAAGPIDLNEASGAHARFPRADERARPRQDMVSPVSATSTVADDLADIVLCDHDGRDVRLGDLWRDTTAVLVWLRHYG